MADELSKETLKEEIEIGSYFIKQIFPVAILKKADLAKTSTKKVIQELEKKLDMQLRSRKDEIDKIVMDYINSMNSGEESEGEEEKAKSASDSDSDDKPRKTRGSATRKKPIAKAKAPKRAGGAKGKGTGFTRPYKLSPQLSELMGADEMPRHAVVKRIWAIVKEKQLYDPNNKQFAICDDALFKVIGKQRFRVFGMMKYLKTHFILD
ncbi:Upstream activation factor subunit spp27 [Operophtera brumata]|uniref:Upstream activation factor subunit spp27 n=1 Tax=Operophtera brumata TaxID=104452 RepID=A0A0L7LRI1_OPEBR|nr:Upstream activation factor subunit spp27 [Operophtera brumata]